MNKKVLQTLEYYKIIDMLLEEADTPLAKESIRHLLPSSRREEIISWQTETSHALMRLLKQGRLPFHGLTDIRPSLVPLEKGGVLGMGELLDIARCLEIAKEAIAYNAKFEDLKDALSGRFGALMDLPDLRLEINRCILSPEEMADDASSELKRIRRAMKTTNDKVREQLTATMNLSGSMLRDNIVTMRNGRYCLPVKQEYKSTFPGMIHDQSSTGSTFFIEPMAIVQLNNELAELGMKEQEEIEKILASLSALAAPYAEDLQRNVLLLAELDFIFAKAKLSKKMQGSEPLFDQDYIHIKKGRHPLIPKDKVVPIDVTLGKTYDLLIITGPNTGGKTVSLKTVGLFTLMGQAGLHIPAYDHSHLRVYEEVYADIGDEQSIEQSLSTFSSHMVNTVYILKRANKKTLALFDELGAGTDPTEGAALAIAILDNLHNRNVTAMATTHYSELKIYALSTDGVENASCEFDVESLQPTYRLLVGVPGKSNAFAISRKLGLDEHIIEGAADQIDESVKDFETILADLEKSKQTIEKEQEEILEYRKEIETLRRSLKSRQDNIKEKRDKMLRDAREEAHNIISEAKEIADSTIREYNKLKKQNKNPDANKKMEHMRSDLRGRMTKLEGQMAYKSKKKNKKRHEANDFHVGDEVYVTSLSLAGTVSTLPNAKGDLYVQMGMMRSLVNIKDLEITKTAKDVKRENQRNESRNRGRTAINKSASIRPEINVMGMTVDEAIAQLDKYIDDACLANLAQITVVHGKGTGALRKGLHNYFKQLKKQKRISGYRDGEYGEGDLGVTVVIL